MKPAKWGNPALRLALVGKRPALQDTQARKEQRVPLSGSCRLQLSEDSGALSPGEPDIPPLHHPPWARTAEGRIPAGAPIVCLTRAFLAMPSPARPWCPRNTRLA